MTSHLRARIEGLRDVSTVPHTVKRLTALMSSTSPSTAEVAEQISQDQVLSARVLKLVNSGFCGFRRPIGSIHHALVLLGLDAVRALVCGAPLVDLFAEGCRRIEGLWEHSVGTARAAHAIAELVGLPRAEEVAVAGLLHDLGKVIIAEAVPAEFERIGHLIDERDCLQFEAEKAVLGVTHEDVGMWLLKKWGLPPQIVYPVAYHHRVHRQRDFAEATAVVHMADILCRAIGAGYPGDRRMPAIDPTAWDLLSLTMDDTAAALERISSDCSLGSVEVEG